MYVVLFAPASLYRHNLFLLKVSEVTSLNGSFLQLLKFRGHYSEQQLPPFNSASVRVDNGTRVCQGPERRDSNPAVRLQLESTPRNCRPELLALLLPITSPLQNGTRNVVAGCRWTRVKACSVALTGVRSDPVIRERSTRSDSAQAFGPHGSMPGRFTSGLELTFTKFHTLCRLSLRVQDLRPKNFSRDSTMGAGYIRQTA